LNIGRRRLNGFTDRGSKGFLGPENGVENFLKRGGLDIFGWRIFKKGGCVGTERGFINSGGQKPLGQKEFLLGHLQERNRVANDKNFCLGGETIFLPRKWNRK